MHRDRRWSIMSSDCMITAPTNYALFLKLPKKPYYRIVYKTVPKLSTTRVNQSYKISSLKKRNTMIYKDYKTPVLYFLIHNNSDIPIDQQLASIFYLRYSAVN
ncbi:hypothetical protein PHYBLDRAFT_70279 [Phycomyces blakesleeanus NRRL 1555(-)]|uniref:Uncharacterized protein n=1 Tax=Phycomyces blakesleeanus (strain ATCC 8743b / DSM 1359 / FGSC 10004 / NBRC 33097 / NRRL 1555) TaxID=763407 RepID=A0A167JYL4_PHYB8|nr:hypothetical protein PHYBLDRAFT_70279 [Phycomyces blakesleeanus NRRL 1555(-)]OAD66920.1 hypothetical protein PHYBLDRAFT_70279 [Phycomyces blakesleeanus NRRL 1555(-)]|eukprot:XP_018284960.1 hypothetical protein PHYBLDRAFT_70279 [Phycomyces blakesleeanus NRRL 1555(-)]